MATVWQSLPEDDRFIVQDFGLGMLLGVPIGVIFGMCFFVWKFLPMGIAH
jgi:hypothetical protein